MIERRRRPGLAVVIVVSGALPVAYWLVGVARGQARLLPVNLLLLLPMALAIAYVRYPSWTLFAAFVVTALVVGGLATGFLFFYYVPAIIGMWWHLSDPRK